MILNKKELKLSNDLWVMNDIDYSREMGASIYELALITVGKQLSKNWWVAVDGVCDMDDERLEDDWLFQDRYLYPNDDTFETYIDDIKYRVEKLYICEYRKLIVKCYEVQEDELTSKDAVYFVLEGI